MSTYKFKCHKYFRKSSCFSFPKKRCLSFSKGNPLFVFILLFFFYGDLSQFFFSDQIFPNLIKINSFILYLDSLLPLKYHFQYLIISHSSFNPMAFVLSFNYNCSVQDQKSPEFQIRVLKSRLNA